MTEDCIWSAGVAAVAGMDVGAVVEGGGAGSRHPLRQAPPRLVFLRAVAVPVRVVGVPVSHQQSVTGSWERRRVEVRVVLDSFFRTDSTLTHMTIQVTQLRLNSNPKFANLTQLRLNSKPKFTNLTHDSSHFA